MHLQAFNGNTNLGLLVPSPLWVAHKVIETGDLEHYFRWLEEDGAMLPLALSKHKERVLNSITEGIKFLIA